jgi:hypothetical protein
MLNVMTVFSPSGLVELLRYVFSYYKCTDVVSPATG